MEVKKLKGTDDILGLNARNMQYLNNLIAEVMDCYNYKFIRTPVFEATELFHRGIGDSTDIVTKETYDFKDRGDRSITLRPEGTAGVVRSYIENKMFGDAIQPVKLYYNETMYRYERPQAGRSREFTQFGFEAIGSDDPLIDAEVISLPVHIFNLLGLKHVKVNINSLGDKESREQYKKVLVEYFKPRIKDLCPDCQNRLEKNPLRILDCKFDADNGIIKNAPKTIDYLNEESKARFDKVCKYLDAMEIAYTINPNVIRGLDYYDHTVFEIEADIKEFGAQNILGGGGRYNKLVSDLGGPETPAIGFASGIERLLLAIEKEEIKLINDEELDAFVMYVSDSEKEVAANITYLLRQNGYHVDTEYMGRALKGEFKQADRFNSRYYIILNDEELKNKIVTIKDVATKEESKVEISNLIDYLDTNY